jgi:hypothetical protein
MLHALCTQHANTMLALRKRFTVLRKSRKSQIQANLAAAIGVICTPQEKSKESELALGDGVRQ